jgi:hypothetical protein
MYFINIDKNKKNKNNINEKIKKKRKKFKNKELKIINEYNIFIPSIYLNSMRNSFNSFRKSIRNSTSIKRQSFINVADFKDNTIIKNDEISSNKISLFKPIDIMYEDDEDDLMVKKILFFNKSKSLKNLKNDKYSLKENDNNENEFHKRTLSENNNNNI